MYTSLVLDHPAVERLWHGDSDVDPAVGHRSEPVLGADVVFTFCDGRANVVVQGPLTTRRTYPHRAGATYLGVRFRPGYSPGLPDYSPHELRDASGQLPALWKQRAGSLAERLVDGCLEQRGRLLSELLHAHISPRPGSQHVGVALARLEAAGGSLEVAELCAELDVSPRRLERLFRAHVGVAPKRVASIIRVRKVVEAVETCMPLTLVALRLGYADQAHMSREVRRVLGTTPGALLAERRHR